MEQPPFKPAGNGWILLLWVFLFWPVAIAYYFMRSWGWERQERKKWDAQHGH